MSGLFRKTSMSESMNSFFGNFANAKANLVEFFMHFDSAMEKQSRRLPGHWKNTLHLCSPLVFSIACNIQFLKLAINVLYQVYWSWGTETVYIVDTY